MLLPAHCGSCPASLLNGSSARHFTTTRFRRSYSEWSSASVPSRLMPYAIPFLLFGPSIAAIVMTRLVDGKPGYATVFSRFLTSRVHWHWYTVALLTPPLVFTLVLLTLSLSSPAFLPAIVTTSDRTTLLLTATSAALLVGFLEDLGWTGFAIPRLRLRYSILTTGLIVGVVWVPGTS